MVDHSSILFLKFVDHEKQLPWVGGNMISPKWIMKNNNRYPGFLKHSRHPSVAVIMMLSTSAILPDALYICLSNI